MTTRQRRDSGLCSDVSRAFSVEPISMIVCGFRTSDSRFHVAHSTYTANQAG
jgi:hypothetical protein